MSDQIDVNQLSNALQQKVDLPSGKSQADIDYVVEWQRPTTENGYTWYRLYKSGWVEQGGYYTYTSQDNNFQIILPVNMESEKYTIITTLRNNNTNAGFVNVDNTSGISSTGFYCRIVNKANAGCSPLGVFWEVKGFAAQS